MKYPTPFLGLAALLVFAPSISNAAYIYVGSWSVYNDAAPEWVEGGANPLAYTGQEAAALLFGGSASNYAISSVGKDASLIDHMAWYDVLGFGGSLFSESYANKYLGQYYGPSSGFSTDDPTNAASAFVRDNFVTNKNYAFVWRERVPDSSSSLLLAAGAFGVAAVAARRRRF